MLGLGRNGESLERPLQKAILAFRGTLGLFVILHIGVRSCFLIARLTFPPGEVACRPVRTLAFPPHQEKYPRVPAMNPHWVDLIAYRLPWLLWLLVTIGWYLRFGTTTLARTLGRVSEHWFPVVLILMVNLMAAGQVGADLGIPLLFRDDSAIGATRNSPAFWGAFSLTVLIGVVWIDHLPVRIRRPL